MASVLFVCTANQVRSVMATAIFKEAVRKRFPNEVWRIESAGTWTALGLPTLDIVLKVMSAKGHDLSDHRSRPVTRPLLQAFQLILTVESGQMEALKIEFPEVADRVYLLSEIAGLSGDIPNPSGRSIAEIQDLAVNLDNLITKGFDRIITLAHRGEQKKLHPAPAEPPSEKND